MLLICGDVSHLLCVYVTEMNHTPDVLHVLLCIVLYRVGDKDTGHVCVSCIQFCVLGLEIEKLFDTLSL